MTDNAPVLAIERHHADGSHEIVRLPLATMTAPLTFSEVGAMLGCDPRTVGKLVADGHLPAVQCGARLRLRLGELPPAALVDQARAAIECLETHNSAIRVYEDRREPVAADMVT